MFWKQPPHGRGQIIALRGETGIGKSRLLAEITGRALVEL